MFLVIVFFILKILEICDQYAKITSNKGYLVPRASLTSSFKPSLQHYLKTGVGRTGPTFA